MKVTVALAGYPFTGKTSLARALCGRFPEAFYYLSSGPIAQELDRRGLSRTRSNYSAVRKEIDETRGLDYLAMEFIRRLDPPPALSIYDGLRGVDALEALRCWCNLRLVFLTAEPMTRFGRIAEKEGRPAPGSITELLADDTFESERELPLLRDCADLTLATDRPFEEVFEALHTAVLSWM